MELEGGREWDGNGMERDGAIERWREIDRNRGSERVSETERKLIYNELIYNECLMDFVRRLN